MSDDGNEGRGWRLYVSDMIEFGEAVLSFVAEINQSEFVADRRTYHATRRHLQLIGEAATHVPAAVRDRHSEIRWREIIGTRNRLVHAYLGIDDDVVWDIIQTDIPKLLAQLHDL